MIQGTMSGAGKSLLVAGLCRIFRQDGYRVAPFKSQNMALNSYITKEGLEMGRAQVMQAEAAGIEPLVCMNPILLKPTSHTGSQVIVNGEVRGNLSARDYFAHKTELIPDIKAAFRKLETYADIIVMRHYLEGAARYASEIAPVPIVNAGDGANQHPSQTMLDLYSIYKTQGTLDNLNIYLVGDLKYGRTVHSLLMAMRHFNPTFHFIAPEELKMPEEYKLYCRQHNIKYIEHTDFTEDTIADADILYMTRVQRERFTDLMEYERVKDVYILRNKMLEKTRPNLRILHPLPRVNEIAYDVDNNEKAYYIQQAQNGLYAREAILCDVLGITLDEVKADTLK